MFPLCYRITGDAGDPVLMEQGQFARVLNRDDLCQGRIKSETAFRDVVFPDAVPPIKTRLMLFSIASQKYASISALKVFSSNRSIGVKGCSLNFLMVKEVPREVTSVPNVS